MSNNEPVVLVTGQELQHMLRAFAELAKNPPSALRVWIDPLDEAVKFKPGRRAWSPPFGQIEVTE